MDHDTLTIAAPRVASSVGVLAPGWVTVRDGRIAALGGGRPPAGERVQALPTGTLAPGLVDLQVNGYAGVDFGDADGWQTAAAALVRHGVTSFLPTLVTAPLDALVARIQASAAIRAELAAAPTARPLGLHLEGPFLSPAHAGAHDPACFCDPTPARLDALLAADPGAVRLLTLAPERDGALAAIRQLAHAGVVPAIGHSDATAAQARDAADAGARMVTHLFNAQRGLHHREPGVVGVGLTDARLTCGLIVDLHHVAAEICRIAFAAAPGRIALVSDASAAAAMPPGRYRLGGEPIELCDGEPPRRADGTLAGSAIGLAEALAHAVAIGVPFARAIDAATRVPADTIGRSDVGRIAVGARADLVWLSDVLTPHATWVGGRLAHEAGAVSAASASRDDTTTNEVSDGG